MYFAKQIATTVTYIQDVTFQCMLTADESYKYSFYLNSEHLKLSDI